MPIFVYEEGELRSAEDGEPFVFKVKEDHTYNQKRYEALGEVWNNRKSCFYFLCNFTSTCDL